MGWHDDFLNEAVRQDLGKSGIKVAETLELNVNDEWYRLISSASPAVVRGYDLRFSKEVVIGEGIMDVTPLTNNFKGIGTGSPAERNIGVRSILVMIKQGGSPDIPCIASITRGVTSRNWIANIYKMDGTVLKEFLPLSHNVGWAPRGIIWDYVNQVGILFFRDWDVSGNHVFYFSMSGTTVTDTTYINNFPSTSAAYHSFPECPEKIYTLFRGAGVLSVKSTTPAVGQAPYLVARNVVKTDGSVVLPVGSNYRSGQAFMFYSRTHESVGVVWMDNTNGRLYYAVEADDWDTAYELTAFDFSADGSSLSYFGNLVLTGENGGEYYVAGRSARKTGNIGRPVGYSFPENLTVMGATVSSSEQIRIFGRIGQVLYVFGVDLEAMSIVNQSSMDLGVTINSAFQPVKIAESNERELVSFAYASTSSGYNTTVKHFMVNIDKATGAILWMWGLGVSGWENSTVWPNTAGTAGKGRYTYLLKYRTELLFLCTYYYRSSDHRVAHRWISASNILDCDTTAEVNTALLAVTYHYDVSSAQRLVYGWKHLCAKESIVWGETGETIFFAEYSSDSVSSEIYSVHFNKTTRALHSTHKEYPGPNNPYKQIAGVVYLPEFSGYSFNIDGSDVPELSGRVLGLNSEYRRTERWDPTLSSVVRNSLWTDLSQTRIATFNVSHLESVDCFVLTSPSSTSVEILIIDYLQSPSFSLYSRTITLDHNAYRVLVDEENDLMLFISNMSGGEIAYTKYKAREVSSQSARLIKATDFEEMYVLENEFYPFAGEHTVLPGGSWFAWRDFSNRWCVVETGALVTDYMGGETPSAGSGSVIYQYSDKEFIPYPFAREGIRAELSNISKTTQITLPETQTHFIKNLLAGGFDPRGSRCILRRIFPDHMGEEGGSIILLDGYIQEWAYSPDKQGIIFTVSRTLLDVNNAFPKRLMNMGCGHVFRGARCQYAGVTGLCPKTKAFCTSLGNVNQFGGFPWVAARQRRVMWR